MSKKRKWSIRDPRSLKKRGKRNAREVNRKLEQLIVRKKQEIQELIQQLRENGIISQFKRIRNSKRALYYDVEITGKILEFKFIIWTDDRSKPKDYTSSKEAKFFIGFYQDVKKRTLKYLEAVKRGIITEFLTSEVLEELEKEKKELVCFFKKSSKHEDKGEGKDFTITIMENGKYTEIPIQVKSSYKELMQHKLRFKNVPGLYREFTGNLEEEKRIIKKKIQRIIENYKNSKIIFI